MSKEAENREQHAEKLLQAELGFRQQLIQVRKKRKLTQEDVARLIGITQGAVAHFEQPSANPTLGGIRRYALAIGADIDFKVRKHTVPRAKRTGKTTK